MQSLWTETHLWIVSHESLLIPLLIAIWISWSDLRTRKIPNYLTLSAALTGLLYNLAASGWSGLTAGILGLFLGFGFLILPYILGGMGAGDVKALAALGAWLGPLNTLYLICYMGIAGGLLSLGVLLWKGQLWQKVLNVVLSQDKVAALVPAEKTPGIPYGVAMALGMMTLMISVSIWIMRQELAALRYRFFTANAMDVVEGAFLLPTMTALFNHLDVTAQIRRA